MIKRKIIILSLLFVLTCFFAMIGGKEAGAVQNKGSAFGAPSLPVMCFSWQNQWINPVYAQVGSESRGGGEVSVYPFLSDDLTLNIQLNDGREQPRLVSYTLRDESDLRLVSKGGISEFVEEDSAWYFRLRFEDILTPDHYYLLSLTVSYSSQEAYYHTRVMKVADPEALLMLTEYAANMHQDLFQRDTARAYIAHLETDTFSDKDTLAYVNLSSSFDQLAWGNGGISPGEECWLQIEAIQGDYVYLSYHFLAETLFSEELPISFAVKESISLQKYGLAIYLLNYERRMNQIWECKENAVTTEGFLLGIQDPEEMECLISENGRFYCFSIRDALYLYDVQESKLTKIFGTLGSHPLRMLQEDYLIRIMDVSDEGIVEFALCGSMPQGVREGRCGISYCRFEAGKNQITEEMYLQSSQTPYALMNGVRRLFVKGNDSFLYFVFDEEVLVMDIDTGETAVLVSRAEYPGLVMNDARTALAWSSETDQERPASLRIMDVATGQRNTLNAAADEFLRPLGFLRSDLVVGYGPRENEILQDGVGTHYPYSSLMIYSDNLTPLHRYSFENTWIDHVDIFTDRMMIHRFSMNGDSYAYQDPDMMMRSDAPEGRLSHFSTYKHDGLKKMVVLNCSDLPSSLRIEQMETRLFVRGKELALPSSGGDAAYTLQFYAYGKNEIIGAYAHLGAAIAAAKEVNAYVLNREGQLVWCWVGRQESKILDVGTELLRKDYKWIEISGITLRELLYYLHEDRAVRWVSPDQGDVWLIGYEWQNVVLYNPETGSVFRMLQTDFDEKISRDNNYLWVVAP